MEVLEGPIEDLLPDLSLRSRVVPLAFEGGPELDRGDEERVRPGGRGGKARRMSWER